jgi:hypothetical protein
VRVYSFSWWVGLVCGRAWPAPKEVDEKKTAIFGGLLIFIPFQLSKIVLLGYY